MSSDARMDIKTILRPDAVKLSLIAADKEQLLRQLAKFASSLTTVSESAIFDVLREREQLGATGVGSGIAIPHGRIRGLDRLQAFFVRLDRPVPFEAIDDQPVDLVFLLLAPVEAGTEQLKALATISRLLRDNTVCEKIRRSTGANDLYALLTQPPSR
jgi:PTS system nitrogen regulatory IIA component